jgi:uncharacterized protein (DUF433 family)
MCIDGTRITVLQIAVMENEGLSPEEIAAEYSHLNLAQVHAALSYYHANLQEIERQLEDDATLAEQLKQQHQAETANP